MRLAPLDKQRTVGKLLLHTGTGAGTFNAMPIKRLHFLLQIYPTKWEMLNMRIITFICM